MKKFNIFIVSYCLLLILAIIVNSIIESKSDYTISAIYSTYMIYLVIGAVLLIIVRIIIQLCLIKDNSTASIFIRGIVVIFLIFVGLLTTVFPALIEEKVYFERNYGKVVSWNEAYSVIEKMDKKIAIFENMLGISICDEKTNIVLLDSELQDILQNGNQENVESGVQINLFTLSNSADEKKNNKKNIENIYKLLSEKEIIAYNVKEYMKNGESEYFGYSVGGKTYGINNNRFGIKCTEYFDILLARYVLGTESLQEIEEIILDEFGVEIATFEEKFKKERRKKNFSDVSDNVISEFLSKRTFFIYKLETILKNRLQNEQFLNIFDKLESRLIPVLAQMEETGIKIDKKYFGEFQNELEEKINMLQNEIYELAGEEFNIDSPQQLGEVLFEKLQIPSGKKTKTGYSTNVEVLEMIANNGELAEDKRMIGKKLLEYRAYKKLLSTYIEPIPKLADKEDRIHTTFNQNGTSTGRLSSANPNLQNIPVRTDDGIRIRTGFVAKEGHSLISFDYSQIELRVLAELSKDKHLVQAYQDDQDLHSLTARKIFFKTEEDEISRNERSIAKVINFSILYGKTPFGLSKELGITVQEASQYIRTYFEEYPRVRKFLEIVTETAKLHGFVETFYGTRRYKYEDGFDYYMFDCTYDNLMGNKKITKPLSIFASRLPSNNKFSIIMPVNNNLTLNMAGESGFGLEDYQNPLYNILK